MPDSGYQPPPGYATMGDAAERLRVSTVTLRKLLRESGVELFQDPRNKRVRLVKAEDLERLALPVPMVRDQELKTAA